MLDLDNLDVSAASEAGSDLTVLHPTSGEPTEIVIQIAGPDSKRARDADREMTDKLTKEAIDKKLTPDDETFERMAAMRAAALTEFVIDGVADVMRMRPDWPERGLAWIEAFDRVSLLGTLERMRALKCFTVKEAPKFYCRSLQNQLRDILDPTPTSAPPKRGRKRRS